MEQVHVELPSFVPFDRIKICSNIVGTKYIFKIGDYIPMLIGRSSEDKPLVWFYAKLANGDKFPVVERNEVKHRQIRRSLNENIIEFEIENPISKEWVTFFKMIISDWYTPEIIELDLRPFGLNIYGDNNSLYIGNSCLKENIITGSEYFYKIDRP